MKRGTIKAFREYLNAKFAGSEKHHNHCNDRRFEQKTREYGDYLYYQDRDKFNVELQDALAGTDHKDFRGVDRAAKTT